MTKTNLSISSANKKTFVRKALSGWSWGGQTEHSGRSRQATPSASGAGREKAASPA